MKLQDTTIKPLELFLPPERLCELFAKRPKRVYDATLQTDEYSSFELRTALRQDATEFLIKQLGMDESDGRIRTLAIQLAEWFFEYDGCASRNPS